MRSKLFVPASRPELFSKAMTSQADGISFDLEDAVTEARKPEARQALSLWFDQLDEKINDKLLIVRVNAMETAHFEADIDAVVRPGLHVINLPKPESAQAVREAVRIISLAERRNGVNTPVKLLLNIETPKALREAASFASADARVLGLQVGLGDLFEPLGIDRREIGAIQQVLFAVRMAAGEAGVEAYDGAFANVSDSAGFLAEAQMAKRLGFAGKSCIHPSQIAMANNAFAPSTAEIAHALKVVAATANISSQEVGAFLVDGHMIDAPFIRRANAIVAIAKRLNLLPST
jgi:citrate lyase beta subunit